MMSRREKIADTLSKLQPLIKSDVHLKLCRDIADDLGLAGYERQTFLRESKASES